MKVCAVCGTRKCMTNGSGKLKKICRVCKKKPYARFKKDSCEFCGFVPVHPAQLDVDHKDGNHSNNHPSNLVTLCANCHRLKTVLNGEHFNKGHKQSSQDTKQIPLC